MIIYQKRGSDINQKSLSTWVTPRTPKILLVACKVAPSLQKRLQIVAIVCQLVCEPHPLNYILDYVHLMKLLDPYGCPPFASTGTCLRTNR